MNLALLGCTPETLLLLPALAEAGLHLTDAFDLEAGQFELVRQVIPAVRPRDDWESLIHTAQCDAVLIAGPLLAEPPDAEIRSRREDQLRKLVQAGMPLLVVAPACAAILGFELEMIRRDTHGILAVLSPGNFLTVLPTSLPDEAEFEQLVIERELPERSRRAVLAAFAQDAETLKRFLGPLRRVSAAGGALSENRSPDLANLSVTLTGEQGRIARWSVLPVADQPRTTWTFYRAGQASKVVVTGDDFQIATAAALRDFVRALRKESFSGPAWMDACRTLEVVEAIDRSLLRGRTIELHNEEVSEESSFKGTMAVGGCLLMMLGLGVFMAMGIFATLWGGDKTGGQGWLGWQICFLLPFALFLLVQLLSFGLPAYERRKQGKVSKPAEPKSTAETADRES